MYVWNFNFQFEDNIHSSSGLSCSEIRRYAIIAFTNLTFGNTTIKSYLCSYKSKKDIIKNKLSVHVLV